MATLVTFEAVAAAAETLQASGQRASVRAVTAALGGGSPNTVLKLLSDWKAGRPVVRIADTEIDSKITEAIKLQMQKVAEGAAATAEEKAAALDEDLQTLSAAQAQAEQQIATLTTELDKSKDQAIELAEQIDNARADADRAEQTAVKTESALRLELATERQRFEAVSASLARSEVRLEALPGLQSEIERLRTALDVDQQARQKAEQQAAVLTAKLEAAERRATEADARTVKVETINLQLMGKLDAAVQNGVNLNAVIQASHVRLEAAAKEIESLKLEHTKSTKGKVGRPSKNPTQPELDVE